MGEGTSGDGLSVAKSEIPPDEDSEVFIGRPFPTRREIGDFRKLVIAHPRARSRLAALLSKSWGNGCSAYVGTPESIRFLLEWEFLCYVVTMRDGPVIGSYAIVPRSWGNYSALRERGLSTVSFDSFDQCILIVGKPDGSYEITLATITGGDEDSGDPMPESGELWLPQDGRLHLGDYMEAMGRDPRLPRLLGLR